MCARFTLRRRLNLVMKELAAMLPVGLFDFDPEPAYNIAPMQKVAAVRATADAGKDELVPLKWGLIPSWAKGPKIALSLINARAEAVAEKPSFRSAFKRRRCLILADGYYEWQAWEEAALALPLARRQAVRVRRPVGNLEAARRRPDRRVRNRYDGGK